MQDPGTLKLDVQRQHLPVGGGDGIQLFCEFFLQSLVAGDAQKVQNHFNI